jgi:hypothetical protein
MKHVAKRAFFASEGMRAHDLGYSICPVIPSKKAPAIRNWRRLAFAPGPADLVTKWATKWATHSVGFPCGRIIGIDVDMTDPMDADRLEGFITALLTTLLRQATSAPSTSSEKEANSSGSGSILLGVSTLGMANRPPLFRLPNFPPSTPPKSKSSRKNSPSAFW